LCFSLTSLKSRRKLRKKDLRGIKRNQKVEGGSGRDKKLRGSSDVDVVGGVKTQPQAVGGVAKTVLKLRSKEGTYFFD